LTVSLPHSVPQKVDNVQHDSHTLNQPLSQTFKELVKFPGSLNCEPDLPHKRKKQLKIHVFAVLWLNLEPNLIIRSQWLHIKKKVFQFM